MDTQAALKIADDFLNYIRYGNKDYIKKYSKEDVKSALSFIPASNSHKQWYKEMEKYIEELEVEERMKKEKRWWNSRLFVGIASSVVSALILGSVSLYIYSKQSEKINQIELVLEDKNRQIAELKKENNFLRNKKPEIPVTVIDKSTGNQLYIGRPLPRKTHYEFPITLNDGKGSYRIDHYYQQNKFKAILVIKESKK